MHRLLAGLLLLAAGPACAGNDHVRSILAGSGFEGTALVGEPDGSSEMLVFAGSTPLQAGDIWRWASITKQLAAVLVMQEVERGRIDLDSPVTRYWPEWKAPNAGRIRIRDLLGHRSGLPDPDSSPPLPPTGFPGFYGANAAPPEQSADGFCAGTPRDEPGKSFLYNNCDYVVLGEVLRRVTGKSFTDLAQERLAGPLGMEAFGVYRFGKPRPPHVAPTGEDAEPDKLLDLGLYGASGGAYGRIGDLWRFGHALVSGKLLGQPARTEMWRSKPEGYAAFGQWVWPLMLKKCGRDITVVERQGLIGGIESRHYLLAESGRGLILFARKKPANYGDPWDGKGLSYELLEDVGCR